MTGTVSEREAEVLAAVGEHLTNAQIASRLHLSVRTVESHVSSLLRKLDVADRRALATLAPTVATSGADAVSSGVRGLPAAWTAFVGRNRERAAVLTALQDARLVTVLGPGGIGKTRLAGIVAEQLAPDFPFGATFVPLVSVRPGFVEQAIAAVLEVTQRPGRSLREAALDRLGHGRSLLVLDNCEHVVEEAADFLAALLGIAGEATVLATSRERLGIAGEHVIPLSGMSLVDATGNAAGSDAVTLFVERARAVDPSFDADPKVVQPLCAQLDGIPLAIELASARTGALGVDGLRTGLDDRLRLLSGGRSADRRHRSLGAMLDWSHDLLDDDERTAFRRVGRFAGDFDLAAASAVADLPVATIADLVGRLTDKSLLMHRSTRHGARWSLLDTVRAYAMEKVAESREADEVRDRHLRWAIGVASDLEERLESQRDWRDRFDLVADDLRAALTTATDDVQAHGLARALGHLAYARRFLAESREHYCTAAEHAPEDRAAAADLRLAADVAQIELRGELMFALRVDSGQRAAEAGDAGAQAIALAEAISAASRFPAIFERDVPLERLHELLATAEHVAPRADASVEAHVTAARAWTETRTVHLPDVPKFERALDAARRAGDPVLMGATLDALGSATIMNGRFRETFRLDRERRGLLARLAGHDPHAGVEIHDLLHMAVENAIIAGELPAALEPARLLRDQTIVAAMEHTIALKRVVPYTLMGRFAEAIQGGREGRAAWERAGCPPARWMAQQVYAVALCHGLRGETAEYDEWSGLARDRLAGEQSRNVHFQLSPMATFVDARFALHTGDLDAAVAAIADVPTAPDGWWTERHWWFDAYPWAIAAEVAVVAGLPDAEARVAAARPASEENLWAAACLARVRGRMSGDPAAFADSLAGWERIGARYERACTLLLNADRVDEGGAELDAVGATSPSHPMWS